MKKSTFLKIVSIALILFAILASSCNEAPKMPQYLKNQIKKDSLKKADSIKLESIKKAELK